MTQPLNNLLKKEVKWNWSQECEESFIKIKEALTKHPVLRQPDFTRQFTLFTDASGFALGALLSQQDEYGNEYAVAYASR